MIFDFSKKTVLVTGASRGIGKRISNDFESLGANVVRLSSADFDLTQSSQLQDLVGYLESLKIDICINNAGINKINYLWDVLESDYDRIMQINTKAPFFISKVVSQSMKANSFGRIVNIASIFGHCTKKQRSCYTTSKFALIGMTKTLAIELAPYNVLVNSVSPGFTATDLTTKVLGSAGIEEVRQQIPIGRLAAPSEISKVVLFLSSEHNSYLTGQNIIVDGGFVNV